LADGPAVPGCGTFSLPRPLEEGEDYTLRTVGDFTEIVPISCTLSTPGINAGDTIEVDYRHAVFPDLSFRTTAWRVDLAVDYGWIRPYFTHEQQDQDLVSGQGGDFLNDRQLDIVGTELRFDRELMRVRFSGQAERFISQERSYETFRAHQDLLYARFGRGTTLGLNAEQVRTEFSRPEDRETRIRALRAVWTYALHANLFAEAFASVRDLEDTLVVDERSLEAGLTARWIFGKLEIIPALKLIDRRRGDTDTTDYRATLRVVRRF
jgi:hypothetical protein